MNTCKKEEWAHRLATMPTSRLLDVEEALSRAIPAEEELAKTKIPLISNISAFPKDVNFSRDRTGLPCRRCGGLNFNHFGNKSHQNSNYKNFQMHGDGKNPIRNYMRMLCRGCLSDEHLLRESPSLTSSKKIRIVSHVFNLDYISCDSDECHKALDEIQDLTMIDSMR